MRGNNASLALIAAASIVLAQLTGCGSCVKDEPAVDLDGGHKRPLPLKAASKTFTPSHEAGADASE